MNNRVLGRRARAGLTQSSAVVLGVALGIGLPRISTQPQLPASVITPVLLGVAGAVFGTIAILFSLLFLVVQWVATAFTPRLTLFRDSPIVWRSAAFAVGIIVFCIVALLASARHAEVSVAVPVTAIALTLVMLLILRRLLIQALGSTQIAPVLATVGDQGRTALAATYPATAPTHHTRRRHAGPTPAAPSVERIDEPTESVSESDDPEVGPQSLLVRWIRRPEVLQRVRTDRLVHAAAKSDAVVVLRIPIGTTLRVGAPVASVHGGSLGVDAVLGTLVGGPERTFEQDPLLAFRLLADIGLRATSTGINDPASAAAALDEMEYLLVQGVDANGQARRFADKDGRVRLVVPRPSWNDMLATAVDELIVSSRGSPLVQSRLVELLDRLLDEVHTSHQRQEVKRRRQFLIPNG